MSSVTLFLAGDVMTGRGIDQVLLQPSVPTLLEQYVSDARDYVKLAERANGPIAAPVAADYIWGDALGELRRVRPALRIVNLETSVTRSDDAWPGKGIHYRMHPGNLDCLTAAAIDGCALANNHVLDWGRAGLRETLESLRGAGIRTAGAGADRKDAWTPAAFDRNAGARLAGAHVDCRGPRFTDLGRPGNFRHFDSSLALRRAPHRVAFWRQPDCLHRFLPSKQHGRISK
jgi:poly-gamma-glutamate capsule biosynthesis protein CapA/YwtB (metallophosphatase superfamily)